MICKSLQDQLILGAVGTLNVFTLNEMPPSIFKITKVVAKNQTIPKHPIQEEKKEKSQTHRNKRHRSELAHEPNFFEEPKGNEAKSDQAEPNVDHPTIDALKIDQLKTKKTKRSMPFFDIQSNALFSHFFDFFFLFT
jgi:hypothetical protein